MGKDRCVAIPWRRAGVCATRLKGGCCWIKAQMRMLGEVLGRSLFLQAERSSGVFVNERWDTWQLVLSVCERVPLTWVEKCSWRGCCVGRSEVMCSVEAGWWERGLVTDLGGSVIRTCVGMHTLLVSNGSQSSTVPAAAQVARASWLCYFRSSHALCLGPLSTHRTDTGLVLHHHSTNQAVRATHCSATGSLGLSLSERERQGC